MNPLEDAPVERTPVRRFANDVIHKSDSLADMWIAVEKLLRDSGVSNDQDEINELIASESVMFDDSPYSDGDKRDILATLPLRLVGPHVDQTKSLAEIRAWYTSTIPYILIAMQPEHTRDCLESIYFASSNRCEHGGQCPVIVIAKSLEESLFDDDFVSEKYAGSALFAQTVAVEKEKIAVELQFRSAEPAEELIEDYNRRFHEFLNPPK